MVFVIVRRKNFLLFLFLFMLFISMKGLAQTDSDTTKLPYQIKPQSDRPYDPKTPSSNLNLKDPKNITTEVEYDQENNQYIIRKKAGTVDYATPYSMSFDEYTQYDIQKSLHDYWRQRYQNETFEQQNSLIPNLNIGNEVFETIFGSNTIDIKPQGSASLRFGLKITNTKNPNIPEELRRQTTFDFKEEIQMNVTGKIGENLEMKVSYNTESQFEFDNKMNLRYQGKEDDILQKIEAGNVSLPLSTTLISGSQSLFGILSEMKFGKLYVSSVVSQQKGETKTITTEGGAQKSDFDISVVDYDKNRHFFLSHYFRKKYDEAMKHMPLIVTPVSITKIEVWVTNDKGTTENGRNIIAFMDLGEEESYYQLYGRTERAILDTGIVKTNPYNFPDNEANNLYEKVIKFNSIRDINNITKELESKGFKGSKHYEKVEYARRLSTSEYTLDPELGYISLNTALNADEVLAVAFEYTVNGQTFKVGELSNEGIESPNNLVVKLLRGTNFTPKYPNWDLMMKNIYSLGGYQINKDDFKLEIEYYNDKTRVFKLQNSLLDAKIQDTKLLNLMNLDNLNSAGNKVDNGDGVFDFVEGATIKASNGRIIFPEVEPFGGHLADTLGNPLAAEKYVYQELYDSTQYKAQQVTKKNKFFLKGSYKSSGGSDIMLNSFNIPEGSVKVTAGGITLTEGVDYTVDYNMGRVKIINEAYLVSGTPIKVSLESNSMFSIQSKRLMGTHLEYRFNDDFNLGGTIMNLTEKPLTKKVSIGEEPISNTIWGLNGSYKTDAPFLTKAVDFLPLLETKEKSSITFEGEFAQLIPGHNTAIGKSGNAYIDDFEGSESSYDLTSKEGWVMASVPQGQLSIFPNANLYNDLKSGFGRAKLAWYKIDQTVFFHSGSPVSSDQQSSLKVYRVEEQDIFPNRDQKNGIPTQLSTFDLTYNPQERGPYNYDPDLNSDGTLKNPSDKWAGIMRQLTTNDFEASNIEYLEFWMMDPFVEDDSENPGGDLIFNFGNISEDILKDSRKSYEHGLPTEFPTTGYDTTVWGRVPATQHSATSFVNDNTKRGYQDIGLDGLSSQEIIDGQDEQTFFSAYLTQLQYLNPDAYQKIFNDPSGDDYKYFKNAEYSDKQAGIIERYMNYNGMEGNSPVSSGASTTYGTSQPDVEDINGDFTLSENESYFQYKVHLQKKNMEVGQGFITDMRDVNVTFKNKTKANVKWYQFRIPLSTSQREQIGDIQDFKSVRFMRMLLHGWDSSVTLRFATLQLVRSEWRKYEYVIKEGEESLIPDNENFDPTASGFSVSTVNIEESGSRYPVNYLLPPGVDRQQDPSQQQLTQLNEQSMSIRVDSLVDGYSKAVYKNISMDMRDYKRLQMYIHAEARGEEDDLEDNDVTCFIRIGSDYTDNYYEYELPLKITPWRQETEKPYLDNSDNRNTIWPEENNVNIAFSDLLTIKQARNNAIRSGTPNVALTIPYSDTAADHRITVKGNPNLATVKTILIGIRNPLKSDNRYKGKNDNGDVKSAEIWVNELRLTDFDESGGWAAMGRMTMRLADFGSISVAGSTTQPGFGSIEQTGQERAKEQTNQVDVAVNLEMGKFFPKETNVRIPMFVGYSRTAINPEYNPLDQDIPMESALAALTPEEKKQFKKEVQDITERKSINFTNVGIGSSGKGKPKFYSPSNVSVSYAYSEISHRDISTSYNNTYLYNGSINYVFNNQPKPVEPFKNVKFLKKPYMRLIGDFNFYYAPSQIAYRTGMDRKYNETLLRNLNNPEQTYEATCDKYFDWDRQFDLKYSFSKGLKFEWSVNTTALIEEPEGLINKDNKSDYERYRQDVWTSIMQFGRAQDHNQKFNASYTIPINKIPLFDWISATARYSSTYNWERAPDLKDDDYKVGNTIKNSGQISGNLQFNMDNLYNKVGFLSDINKKYKKSRKDRLKPQMEDVEYIKENIILKANQAKTISHGLNTEEEIAVSVMAQNGKPVESSFNIINENRVEVTVKSDMENVTVTVKGKREKVDSPLRLIMEGTALTLMGLKQLSVAYTVNGSSTLLGYNKNFDFMELKDNPGLAYVFGMQDTAFAQRMIAAENVSLNSKIAATYAMANTTRHDFKATYQPIKDLRIDFSGQRSITENRTLKYFDSSDPATREIQGAYTVNVWSIKTSFTEHPTKKNVNSKTFDQYRYNLHKISWDQADERRGKAPSWYNGGKNYNPEYNADTLAPGYTTANPDIAIPAFLAAYTGSSTNKSAYNFMNWMFFRPGWRLKYDGLINYEFISKYFKNVTLSHGYNSTFTVGSFENNLRYNPESNHISWATSTANPDIFVPQRDIASFAITEQFSPLFGIDMTWRNSIITKFEYKKSRTMTMSLVNNEMLELFSREYVIGSGYRIEKLQLPFQLPNQTQKPVSDLNLRADFTIRDNISITRNVNEHVEPEVTAGQLATALNISAEYQFSEKLTIRFYFDRTLTDPKMTKTYRNSDTQFGFQFKFSLAEL